MEKAGKKPSKISKNHQKYRKTIKNVEKPEKNRQKYRKTAKMSKKLDNTVKNMEVAATLKSNIILTEYRMASWNVKLQR